MTDDKLYVYTVYGGKNDDEHYMTHVVGTHSSPPNAQEVLAEYMVDEIEYVDLNDFYCTCCDDDCSYCQDPESDESRDYARDSAIDYLREDIEADWERIILPDYDVLLTTKVSKVRKGVPTWDD